MWFPNIRKWPWKNIDLLIFSTLEMLTGVVGLLSLGFFHRDFSTNYIYWRFLKMCNYIDYLEKNKRNG